MQSGSGGFSSFDYQGWNHATDAEFTGNLTYNDESNMFYSSYGTIRNGEATRVGISISGIVNSDNGRAGFLSEAGARWLDKSSGRTGTPMIDPIDIFAGGLYGLFKAFGKATIRATAEAGTNAVYHSVESGVTRYVGITNNLARRAAEHLARKGINIEPLMQGLSRADARAVEQALIEIHGLGRNGGTLLNKINSIARTNPNYASQLERGFELLESIGYQ